MQFFESNDTDKIYLNIKELKLKSKKKFINDFKKKMGIDYRRHKLLYNNYGNTPCFYYAFATEIVSELNNDLIDMFNYKHVLYNFSIDIDRLRITKLKDYIEDRVNEYYF